jgi:hypothetical protein
VQDPRGVTRPWRAGVVRKDLAQARGLRRSRGRTAPRWGQASKGNPRSGTGMKQARQVVGGARRREGEKPCGRN